MSEVRNKIRQVTQELNALLEEFAASPRQGSEFIEVQSMNEILREFRSALDAIRQMLWAYTEASARAKPNELQYEVQNLRFQRAIEMLRSLREGGIPGQKSPGGPSFIEHVNALVDTYEKVSFQRPQHD